RVAWVDWGAEAPATSLALLDGDKGEKAQAYARRSGDLPVDAVADDLATLLAANGVAAVLKPASAQAGQG
ncbi:MAG TPA: hypothetical protein VF495_22580, partial [Phenylobacterium sp.]